MSRNFLSRIKAEFKAENFIFNWPSNEGIQQAGWEFWCRKKFVIIRWLFAVYSLAALCLSIAVGDRSKWIFALTSINYIINTTHFVLSAIIVTWCPFKTDSVEAMESTDISFSLKAHWFLFNLSINLCTFVTVAFWTLLAPTRPGGFGPSLRNFLVIDRHGINLLMLIVDFLLNRIPVRLLHFIYPSLAIGAYYIYNSIYWSITRKLVYGKILDYGSNGVTVTALVFSSLLILSPLIQCCWFSANHLKTRFALTRKRDSNENCEAENIGLKFEASLQTPPVS